MAKLVYNGNTGKYSIKSDSWTNGGIRINLDTEKIEHVPAEYVVYQGTLQECKDYLNTVKRL